MRIAILSDIHDNVWKLAAALKAAREADALICCGDLCSPFVVHQLGRAFSGPIHIVFGNNDGEKAGLRKIFPGFLLEKSAKNYATANAFGGPSRPASLVATQQGVCNIVIAMTRRDFVKPAFPLRIKRSVETHALRLSGAKNLHFASAPFPRFSAFADFSSRSSEKSAKIATPHCYC